MLKSAPASLSADGVAMSFPDGSCMTISVEVHNEPGSQRPVRAVAAGHVGLRVVLGAEVGQVDPARHGVSRVLGDHLGRGPVAGAAAGAGLVGLHRGPGGLVLQEQLVLAGAGIEVDRHPDRVARADPGEHHGIERVHLVPGLAGRRAAGGVAEGIDAGLLDRAVVEPVEPHPFGGVGLPGGPDRHLRAVDARDREGARHVAERDVLLGDRGVAGPVVAVGDRVPGQVRQDRAGQASAHGEAEPVQMRDGSGARRRGAGRCGRGHRDRRHRGGHDYERS